MSIKEKDIKILWAKAAGFCSFSDCSQNLCDRNAENFELHIGHMAHICGLKPSSNRHDPCQTDEDRNSYKNLILLCPNHHTAIDKRENENEYTIEKLHRMKEYHENNIQKKITTSSLNTKVSLAKEILPLLTDNYTSWLNYGPMSEVAKKNPHSIDAKNFWIIQRVTIIVPNNKIISKLIQDNRKLIPPDDEQIVSTFLTHTRSYEKWVKDEINYASVVKFPVDFNRLIKGFIDAST